MHGHCECGPREANPSLQHFVKLKHRFRQLISRAESKIKALHKAMKTLTYNIRTFVQRKNYINLVVIQERDSQIL